MSLKIDAEACVLKMQCEFVVFS